MIHLLAVGSGTNLKNGKYIQFTVTEATSRKGLEGLAKNVLIKHMVVIRDTSHEKITELLALEKKTEFNELGMRRRFPYPNSHPGKQLVIIACALIKACIEERGRVVLKSNTGDLEFSIRRPSDVPRVGSFPGLKIRE